MVPRGVIHINQQTTISPSPSTRRRSSKKTARSTIKVGSELVHEFEARSKQASKNASSRQTDKKK